jgi:acyl carrier protein
MGENVKKDFISIKNVVANSNKKTYIIIGEKYMREKIREFLRSFIDESNIADDDNIFETGLVNSLFAMQLVSFIEKNFEISIENYELDIDNFKDINSIVALVNSKLG